MCNMCHFHVSSTPWYWKHVEYVPVPCKCYTVLCKKLEHLWVLMSAEILGSVSFRLPAAVFLVLWNSLLHGCTSLNFTFQVWPFWRLQKLVENSRHDTSTVYCLSPAPSGSSGHLDTLRTLLKLFPVLGSQKWLPLRPANRKTSPVSSLSLPHCLCSHR